MKDSIKIPFMIEPAYLLNRYGERVDTEAGNTYYRVPFWMKKLPDGSVLLYPEEPEDLSKFITKAGLGGDNPQSNKPIL